MALGTTTIGACPKPDNARLPDWFADPEGSEAVHPKRGRAVAMAALGDDAETIIARGTREAISEQVRAGIDVPTDAEIARENCNRYHCRLSTVVPDKSGPARHEWKWKRPRPPSG